MLISDIKGILGLDSQSGKSQDKKPTRGKFSKNPEKRKRTAEDVARKLLPNSMGIQLDGIMNQIQENQPNINHLAASMKKFGKKPVRKWNRIAFTNPARTDNLKLYHYQREDTKSGEPYAFSSLNKRYPMPKYTDELYDAAFVDDDWTREETDYMMKLVEEYSLIWEVVADRYDFKGTKRNSLDIQKRFYQIEDYIKAFNDEPTSGFDYEAEKARREKLLNYLDYTVDEIEEEEKMLKEYDRLKKMDKELTYKKRQDDLQTFSKTHRFGSFAMMSASKLQQRASTLQRRSLLSPFTSPLKSPTESQLLNIEDVRDFGLTAKAHYNAVDFTTGAQTASEIYLSGPTHKMKFYLSVGEYYEPAKVFSYENVQNTFRIRKCLNSICEQKGSLMLLIMEMDHVLQQLKEKNIEFKKIPEKYTLDYFMKPRPTSHNRKECLTSLFTITPAVFPPNDPIDRTSQDLKRKKNLSIPFPDNIVVPEGLSSKTTLSPSPVRQISTSRNRKRSLKGLSESDNVFTPIIPATKYSTDSDELPASIDGSRKSRRSGTLIDTSDVASPSTPSSSRIRRSIGRKSYAE